MGRVGRRDWPRVRRSFFFAEGSGSEFLRFGDRTFCKFPSAALARRFSAARDFSPEQQKECGIFLEDCHEDAGCFLQVFAGGTRYPRLLIPSRYGSSLPPSSSTRCIVSRFEILVALRVSMVRE